MTVLSVILISIPAAALVLVISRLIAALTNNVKTGKLVRQQLNENISHLRFSKMLQREGVNQEVLLHRIPLTEIEQEMGHCETCQHTNACDQALGQESSNTVDVGFCPNIDAIHKHKLAL